MPTRTPVTKVMRALKPKRRRRLPRSRIVIAIRPQPVGGVPSETQWETTT